MYRFTFIHFFSFWLGEQGHRLQVCGLLVSSTVISCSIWDSFAGTTRVDINYNAEIHPRARFSHQQENLKVPVRVPIMKS